MASSCGGAAEVQGCGEIGLVVKLLMRPQAKSRQSVPVVRDQKRVGKVSLILDLF